MIARMNPRAVGFDVPDHLAAIAPPAQLVAIEPDPRQHCGCARLCAECAAESAYGYEEADSDIAAEYVAADEVAELVMEVREAAGLLDWIAHNVDLPAHLRPSFRELDRRARNLSKRADELMEAA